MLSIERLKYRGSLVGSVANANWFGTEISNANSAFNLLFNQIPLSQDLFFQWFPGVLPDPEGAGQSEWKAEPDHVLCAPLYQTDHPPGLHHCLLYLCPSWCGLSNAVPGLFCSFLSNKYIPIQRQTFN